MQLMWRLLVVRRSGSCGERSRTCGSDQRNGFAESTDSSPDDDFGTAKRTADGSSDSPTGSGSQSGSGIANDSASCGRSSEGY
jgi:hypothetical protein